MDSTEISLGTVIVLQFSLGLSVNVFLLLFYARVVSSSPKPSSSDLILTHLTLANTIILLANGIPETLSCWGWKNFLDDVGCKTLMYFGRVAQGLIVCTTSLLSIFQAVTISPGTSRWAGIKARLPKCIIPSLIIFWILNLLIDINSAIYMRGPRKNGSAGIVLDLKYCSKVIASAEINLIISVMFSFREIFFVGLMSLASGYMVFVLHRHHQRVRHLHGPGRSPGETPEVRAAKRVVAMATLYVLLYVRQTIMLTVILNLEEKSPRLVNGHMVFSLTFSTLSPFLMIHSDGRMRAFWKKEVPIPTPIPPRLPEKPADL
uniref:vomeronasal 1 receptor ornAnaV1R3156 n=1 Tax=Ornithorhynchus anatinus TaxID=9258 RepID=UPI0001555B08|nr:vomeronasal 1 receptor ornAnaV1R3156 [Ornithorhynchus anatinus]